MNKPHKHAELIKQWVEGKQIQVMTQPLGCKGEWSDCNRPGYMGAPSWHEDWEFRIKPEPKPDVIVIDHFKLGRNDKERFYALRDSYGGTKLQMTFDGETGKLKAVELL